MTNKTLKKEKRENKADYWKLRPKKYQDSS